MREPLFFGRDAVGKHLRGDASLKLKLVPRVRRALQRCRLKAVLRALEVEGRLCAVVVAGLTQVRRLGAGPIDWLRRADENAGDRLVQLVAVKLRCSLLGFMCLLLEQTVLLMDRRILLLQFHEHLLNLDHPLEKRHFYLRDFRFVAKGNQALRDRLDRSEALYG